MVLAAFARRACLVVVLSLIPASVLAQGASTATIAGVVKDASGAVLPGVTVEAASPALIEKVRSTVTDDRGQYRFPELRPGAYTVTFTLAGFSTPQTRRARVANQLHRAGGRRAQGQPAAGNDHGHGRDAAGGRPKRHAAAHGVARDARYGAHGEKRPWHCRTDSRRRGTAQCPGRRRQQRGALGPHLGPRRQDVRLAPAAGRNALQRSDARRRCAERHDAVDAGEPGAGLSSDAGRHRPRLLHQPARRR